MHNITIRQGARFSFEVEQADPSSVSVTFIAQSEDNTFQDTQEYVDGVATFDFQEDDTSVVGEYDFQLNENFATGSPDIYPAMGDCFGEDCDFPTLTICESLDGGSI